MSTSNTEINQLKSSWSENLENISNQLEQILSLSDEQFFCISKNLQYYDSEIKTVSKKNSDVMNLFSSDQYKEIIEKLKSISDYVNNYISKTNSKFQDSENSFFQIVKHLGSIYSDSMAFNKLVKHLDAQGISIKIESARLGNNDRGFNVIAENINNLSVLISDKSRGFRDKTKFLVDLIRNAQREILNLQKSKKENSNTILNRSQKALQTLFEKNELSLNEVEVLHTKSENIKHEIGSLVTAIQFHHITRQQIENVNTVIKNLSEKIALLKENDDPDDNKKLVVYIQDAVKLQSAQLNNSKNELNKAALNIISSLDEIKIDIAGMSEEILKLMDNSGNGNNTFINQVNSGFNEVLASLNSMEEINNEFYSVINKVATTINDLSMFINEISNIGSEIELISLNASIKAAHTGHEGAALGVLAEATQKLSVQSKNDTDSVIKMLVSVWEVSQQLQKTTDTKTEVNEKKNLDSFFSSVEDMFSSLRTISENTLNDLKIISQNSIKIENDIDNSIISMKTYLEIDEKINQIIFDLHDIVNASEIQFNEQQIDKNGLEEFGNNYTMQIQRDIHDAVSSGKILNDGELKTAKGNSHSGEFGEKC